MFCDNIYFGDIMLIVVDNKKFHLKNCKSFKNRLCGNMFKKNIENLLFEKCNSIHTFFMLKNIDVIFLDENNNILKSIPNLEPWKIVICKKAKKVIELPPNTISNKIKIVE